MDGVGNFQFWGVLPIWIIVELIMLASVGYKRCRSRMVRVAWLCRKSPEGREFKAGLCYDYWKTFSVNPAVNG